MYIKWCDKCVVHVLTSIHKDNLADTSKRNRITGNNTEKPDAVLEYIQKIHLVDKEGIMMITVNSLRKSVKWYKKIVLSHP